MPDGLELSEGGCDAHPPAWGVTRQYDFGQFVLLHHADTPDEPAVPLVVYPDGHLNVTHPSAPPTDDVPAGGRAVPITADPVPAPSRSWRPSDPISLLDVAGGVPLSLALTADMPVRALTASPADVEVEDLNTVLTSGQVTIADGALQVALGSRARSQLMNGRPVTMLGRDHHGAGRPVKITPRVQQVDLDAEAIDEALASSSVTLAGGAVLNLNREIDLTTLRSGGTVRSTVRMPDDSIRVVAVKAAVLASSAPLATTFHVTDPSMLIGRRYLPATDGTALSVPFTAQHISDLRTNRACNVTVNGVDIDVQVVRKEDASTLRFDPIATGTGFLTGNASTTTHLAAEHQGAVSIRAVPLSEAIGRVSAQAFGVPDPTRPTSAATSAKPDGATTSIDALVPESPDELLSRITGQRIWPGPSAVTPVLLDERYEAWLAAQQQNDQDDAVPPQPTGTGLQVAVFLPWRQTWTFHGLSRGALLSTIALAPLESRRIRTFSWERKTRSLEQSSETDTSLSQEFTSTTRDTEDVFREMTSSQHFAAQLHADVNASYSTGVASVNASAGGNLSNDTALQQVARSTTQHMTEAVHRASAQVRTQRITRITEAEETVSSNEVISTIRNANESRTLTFNFFEQLAHYRIDTEFLREHVQIVAMVPNPLGSTEFTSLTVRTNEAILQEALLNPELSDAFAAARLLRSYKLAWDDAQEIAEYSKRVAELDRERTKPAPSTQAPPPTHPDNPFEALVLSAAKDVASAAKDLVGSKIDDALDYLGATHKITDTYAMAARRWLWVQLANAKVGGNCSSALTFISSKTAPTIDEARRLLDTFNSSALGQLASLSSLPDNEKENIALGEAIHRAIERAHGALWDWGWWTNVCRSNGLYNPDDDGITGALGRVADALGKYDAKASEGDGLLEQQKLVDQAGETQNQETWVDKVEMKYGLDVVADARERQEALLTHLANHADYYRYVLFQALPPGEQLDLLTRMAPQLEIGFFEPRVVAFSGSSLAVPLTPTGGNELATFIGQLRDTVAREARSAQHAADALYPDDIILPTPGVVVETSLGSCNALEPTRLRMREVEIELAEARLGNISAERARREARLAATPPLLDGFWTTGGPDPENSGPQETR